MRKLALQLVITLTAIGVALAAYDYLRRSDIAETRTQTAALKQQAPALLETTQSQTKELGRQAQALSDQAQALSNQATALKDEVAAEHLEAANQRQRAMIAVYLAQGLQAASSAKVAIAEYYYSTGKPPASNHDAGLVEPEEYKGDSLRRMTISTGGIITLVYDEKSSVDNGKIQLVPDIRNAQAQLNWRCVSPDFTNIATVLPPCQYVAAHDGAPVSD